MTFSRWDIPGPSSFLSRAAADLVAGIGVFVELPATVDEPELRSALHERFPHHHLEVIDCGGSSDSTPLIAVADALGIPAEETPPTFVELVENPVASYAMFWLTGLDSLTTEQRGRWTRAMDQLAAAGDEPGATILVVGCLHGDAPPLDLRASARLRVHSWWNVVTRLDVAVLLTGVAPGIDPIWREEVVEVVGDDLDLAIELASSAPDGEDRLLYTCTQRAEQLSLSEEPAGATARYGVVTKASARSPWLRGALSMVDGRSATHAGLLAMQGRPREVDRRRWASQIRSVLPRMDLLRVELIDRAVSDGVIARHVLDEKDGAIEFSALAHLLARQRHLTREAALARWLHRSRNELAHLRCLSSTEVATGRELTRAANLVW